MATTKKKNTTKYQEVEEDPVADVDEEPLDDDADIDLADDDAGDDDIADDDKGDGDNDGDGEDGDDGENPEGDGEPADEGPPAKVSKTTMLFILLNWIAVPTFLVFAYLDHVERVKYSYRAMLNYVAVWGLPLESEEDFPSLANETRPRLRLTPDQLKEAFRARPGVNRGAGDKFTPVDEAVPLRIRPSDMFPQFLDDVFGDLRKKDLGGTVATLEDEIKRLKTDLPAKIESAGKEVLAKQKSDDDKRDVTRKVLLPLAWDVWQVKKLDDKIAKAKAAELDTLVEEAVQRRLYYDVLAPVNVYRPGDLKFFHVEKIADLDGVKLDEVKGFLLKRLSGAIAERYDLDVHIGETYDKEKVGADAMKRDSVEKRQKIAFILFALGQVKVPTLNRKLYPRGEERAQVVCGMREATNASIYYVRSLRTLEERIAESIVADRQGYVTTLKDKQDQLTRTNGFIDAYENEVDRLVKIVEYIDAAQKRLDDLKAQRDHFQKIHDQRAKQHADTLEQLVTARRNTEKYAKDLRELQLQLHTALVELSDAAERNFALEARIREIELGFAAKTKKGGKKQP